MSKQRLGTVCNPIIAALILLGLPMTTDSAEPSEGCQPSRWAIAIHGGAGRLSSKIDRERRDSMEKSLREALEAGMKILSTGGSALDAAEAAVVILEDDPQFNAGKGAVFTRAGTHELDASIMDGATLRCGGVAGIKLQKNPVKVARLVMDRTPHVLLAGEGAEEFAREYCHGSVAEEYFYTDRRFGELQRALAKTGQRPLEKPAYPMSFDPRSEGAEEDGPSGTVGCVALDSRGNLAAATSTGGMTGKLPGRVGDTPICGAGTYANNQNCAVSCTGKGEQFIRHSIAARIAMLMDERGLDVNAAVRHCLTEVLKPGDGGVIAVDRDGRISMRATTGTMPRGVADSTGRIETAFEIER
jgi:beta-aspartyl-peptidase (threonine type)